MKKSDLEDITASTGRDNVLETALDLKTLRRLAVRTNIRAGWDSKNETDEQIGQPIVEFGP